jgi:hypothetical protein
MSVLTADDLKHYKLPKEAIADLLEEKIFESKHAGRIRLGGESLRRIQLTFLNETENKTRKAAEPKQKLNGRYVCDAISLADCDDIGKGNFGGQIFVWIPQLMCFASWDDDHERSYLFPDLTWAIFSKEPVKYLCAQWEQVKGGEEIWDAYELWKIFPYVIYASEYFRNASREIRKLLEEKQYSSAFKRSTVLLEQTQRKFLGERELTKTKIELLCGRSVSHFMLGNTDEAFNDFNSSIALGKNEDLIQKNTTHPHYFLEHARRSIFLASQELGDDHFSFFSKFLLHLIKFNNVEALTFAEDFHVWGYDRIKELKTLLQSENTNSDLTNSILNQIEEIITDFDDVKITYGKILAVTEKGNVLELNEELKQISKASSALSRYSESITINIYNALTIHCLKKNDFESGRELVTVYASKIAILNPRGKWFEELFANALCLIQSDDQTDREFLGFLEKTFLRVVRQQGQLFIQQERLARNLACVYTTMKNHQTAFVFLKHAIAKGAKEDDILNERDLDPIRNEERVVRWMEKYYPK